MSFESRQQVARSHYAFDSYDEKGRFSSYWHQIYEVTTQCPEQVVEVGTGGGLLSFYLNRQNVATLTLDIAIDLQPDIVASLPHIPLGTDSTDLVVAFQVLEHLPYAVALDSLKEMARVARKAVIVSVPDRTRNYQLSVKLPIIGVRQWMVQTPRVTPLERTSTTQHYWELGLKDFPLSRLVNDFAKIDLELVNTYRVYEYTWHRFFVLSVM